MIGAARAELRRLEAELVDFRGRYFRGPMLELEQSVIGRAWDAIADQAVKVRLELRGLERALFKAREKPSDGGGNAP